ncbi:mitochondrial resolvase Ydc2 [Xylariaceae sp. FL0255]|nr:mitochondrial resolvase Ydc2 [Xylariaceae sp. FL0255]
MAASTSRVVHVNELKRLALFCGLPITGRKDQLVERILKSPSLHDDSSLQSSSDPVVLSIDLGVKNLAFSHLKTTPHKARETKRTKKSDNTRPSLVLSSFGNRPPRINLHTWERLSILPEQSSAGAVDEDQESPFGPPALAKAANGFLQRILKLDPLPTHILIEKQRWRTGGAAAVQEWTIRVNSFEAMIYSSLQTLRDLGAWNGEVTPIRPKCVGPFFLDSIEEQEVAGEELATAAKTTKSRKEKIENNKKLKIGLMGKWLGEGEDVVRPANGEVGEVIDVYRSSVANAQAKKKSRSGTNRKTPQKLANQIFLESKMDDLTDSLMQGMAWLRWRENREILRQHGIERVVDILDR